MRSNLHRLTSELFVYLLTVELKYKTCIKEVKVQGMGKKKFVTK